MVNQKEVVNPKIYFYDVEREKMWRKINRIGSKFCSLRGIVAIIFVLLFLDAPRRGYIIGIVLMGIFAYWSIQSVLCSCSGYRTMIRKRHTKKTKQYHNLNGFHRDLDL